jgi:hypothetical protein
MEVNRENKESDISAEQDKTGDEQVEIHKHATIVVHNVKKEEDSEQTEENVRIQQEYIKVSPLYSEQAI